MSRYSIRDRRPLAPAFSRFKILLGSVLGVGLGTCLFVGGLAIDASAQVTVPVAVLSLAVDDETAPPRGTVQVKLRVTDPSPIITGFADFQDFGDGIALGTPDAAGVGISRAGRLRLRFTFPTDPTPALAEEYPLVSVAGPVPTDLTDGATFPLVLDPGTIDMTHAGGSYEFELAPGELKVEASALSIDRIEPGSAQLRAGDTVHIFGRNFTPGMRVDLNEVDLRRVQFISREHIAVVVAERTLMHGKRVRLRNTNRPRSRVTFYSYQRTRPGTASRYSAARTRASSLSVEGRHGCLAVAAVDP